MESHEDICVVEPNFQVLKPGYNQSFISHQRSVKYNSQGDRARHGCISMLFVLHANIIWWRMMIQARLFLLVMKICGILFETWLSWKLIFWYDMLWSLSYRWNDIFFWIYCRWKSPLLHWASWHIEYFL